jgi:hypothetical protein
VKIPARVQDYLLAKLNPEAASRVRAAEQRMAEVEKWRNEMVQELNGISRAANWNGSLMTREELDRSKEYQLHRLINEFYAKYGALRISVARLNDRLRGEKLSLDKSTGPKA